MSIDRGLDSAIGPRASVGMSEMASNASSSITTSTLRKQFVDVCGNYPFQATLAKGLFNYLINFWVWVRRSWKGDCFLWARLVNSRSIRPACLCLQATQRSTAATKT
jgi:hypothetical protein